MSSIFHTVHVHGTDIAHPVTLKAIIQSHIDVVILATTYSAAILWCDVTLTASTV